MFCVGSNFCGSKLAPFFDVEVGALRFVFFFFFYLLFVWHRGPGFMKCTFKFDWQCEDVCIVWRRFHRAHINLSDSNNFLIDKSNGIRRWIIA